MKPLLSLSLAVLMFTGAAAGDTVTPQIFAPGVISGPANNSAPAFTPDGKTVYFTRSNGSDYDILVSRFDGKTWSQPKIAPFSGKWRDLEPAMAPDGSYLIFASSRPASAGGTPPDGSWGGQPHPGKGGSLWRVDRKGDSWGEAKRLPDTVNRSNNIFSPTIAANGDLYFMDAVGEGMHFRLFMSALKDGVYQAPVAMPFTAGQYGGVDAAVAPDESYMVFSSNRPPAPAGQSDLFIVFRKDGVWGEPQHLPDSINAYAPAVESHLSPDGKTLYFASSHVVTGSAPRDSKALEQVLADMQSWNNSSLNIWQVDISDIIKEQQK